MSPNTAEQDDDDGDDLGNETDVPMASAEAVQQLRRQAGIEPGVDIAGTNANRTGRTTGRGRGKGGGRGRGKGRGRGRDRPSRNGPIRLRRPKNLSPIK